MKVKRLYDRSILPTKAHSGDLGYDLYSADQYTIYGGETKLIDTGIQIQFPAGYGGIIRDRSSVATKKQLIVTAGVIDNGYTGTVLVALTNLGEGYQTIYMGDKIAQLILIPTVDFKVEEVLEVESADGRGAGGFGSTGV
jgi:dUTP pyrophosphatase